MTDSQRYDLVVEKYGKLQRVQVKTTWHLSPHGNYKVELRTKGGNKSGNGKVKTFSESDAEILFVVTAEGEMYLFPAGKLNGNQSIALGDKYEEFKLG